MFAWGKQHLFCSLFTLHVLPVTLYDQSAGTDFWIGEVSNLQRHVHNRRHPSGCCSSGGGPETLPGGAARFIHVNVAVYNAWHHHAVTHIQHLPTTERFFNNAMSQAPERNKIFRSVKSINYNFTDRRIILSSVLRSETQLTWQATSSEKLQLEAISCIFPSFITTTAGRTWSPTSTLVLLTALTVDPSSMFCFLLTVIELSMLDSH